MSVTSSSSLGSDRSPETPYRDAVMSDDIRHHTPSPPALQDDSHDEYTPTCQSIQSGMVWTTPSQRSNTRRIAADARKALNELYERIYGPDSIRCLLTQGTGGLNIAHAVQCASKSSVLTLYEYCLGFQLGSFHVDSRQNLVYLKSDWHIQFDANEWILLPSIPVLEDVRDFLRSVISARKEPAGAEIPAFHSKWDLYSKTQYTFIPLQMIKHDAFVRQRPQPLKIYEYPYQTLPDLECHIAPPFAVINGGPKCAGTDLEAITCDYCRSSSSRRIVKHQLELLCEIWEIFQGAKEDANNWERGTRGKGKGSKKTRTSRGLLSLADEAQGYNRMHHRV